MPEYREEAPNKIANIVLSTREHLEKLVSRAGHGGSHCNPTSVEPETGLP